MKKTLVIIAASLFIAACAGTQNKKCGTCDPFQKTGPCKKAAAAKPGKECNNCNPWKKTEPCKAEVKPVKKPLPPPPPPARQAPKRITSEELGTVAAVRDTGAGQKITFTTPILFETNSDQLKSESYDPIKKIANVLKKHPNAHTTVEGYTDSLGDASYNLDLSGRRAKTVAQALVAEGVAVENISAKGYGIANPIADNKTKEGRAKNRRVELNIETK
ncbi:outer membrane protein OmpA-like peptidoglycan-associated protein [Elusimicrobium posterum]|uniref:OmpA family protein n=1 Tax=Elusimicrobium posterum TaxID=3116653 RepID=UPI003C75EDD3